jgi:predicted RNA-binding protein with PIN domain
MTEMKRVIIDGYNVIRTNPTGSRIELVQGNDAARQWLINLCCRALKAGDLWSVVFDGDDLPSSYDAGGGTLTVRYAAPLTADEMIRELAFHAVSVGVLCTIASSDQAVRAEGCSSLDSSAFYDYLLRHSGREIKRPGDDAPQIVEKLLAYLSACGNLQRGAAVQAATRSALEELIRYFAAEKPKPQKIARDVENMLRESVQLIPCPDQEKTVFRNIKNFFEKNTE